MVLKEEVYFVVVVKTTVPKSGLKRRVVFGVRFFLMKTTVHKSSLERGVVFGVSCFFFV